MLTCICLFIYIYIHVRIFTYVYIYLYIFMHLYIYIQVHIYRAICLFATKTSHTVAPHCGCTIGWLWLVGSSAFRVSFAKEPYKRDYILHKRHLILRNLLILATPYQMTIVLSCDNYYISRFHQASWGKLSDQQIFSKVIYIVMWS